MINETTSHDSKLASTTMILDIVEETLAVAHDLEATSSHVTSSLRVLTGAQAVLLTTAASNDEKNQKLLAFNPKRRKTLCETPLVKILINNAEDISKITFLKLDIEPYSSRNLNATDKDKIENAVIAPLIDKDFHIGNLILLGMPHNESESKRSLKAIKLLSNVLALVLRTALLHKKQDELVTQLEKEVKERIHAEEELKNATAQLIETEKLVSIGQLASGVAHEINTPLGAIRSSNDSIFNNIQALYSLIENDCEPLNKYKELTSRIINNIHNDQNVCSSRELRQHKKDILKKLSDKGITNCYEISNLLANVGIYEDYEEFIPLFNKENENLIKYIQRFSDILQSNNIINIAVEQSSRVVNALKDFARSGENSSVTEVNIKDTINTALTLYRNTLKHGIELKLDFENVPTILGYPEKLCQVWTNLIQNAAYAMNNSGILEISLKKIDDQILVAIADTGNGIPETIIGKIFEPLFTTKKLGEGTGLGLNIVKKIVEKHNGCISVESKPGEGTRFTITFPINNDLINNE